MKSSVYERWVPATHDRPAYRLVYSSRKTLQLSIAKAHLTVRAPKGMSQGDIDMFIAQKRDWIYNKMQEQQRRVSDRTFSPILQVGTKLPWLGTYCLIQESQTAVLKADISQGLLYIAQGSESEKQSQVVRFYQREARQYLGERLQYWSKKTGIDYSRFGLSSAKTRWGSCSKDGSIRLNWRLMALAPELIDYVIVHELCHRRHFNHSPAFWMLVDQIYPQRKTAQVALRGFSMIPILY